MSNWTKTPACAILIACAWINLSLGHIDGLDDDKVREEIERVEQNLRAASDKKEIVAGGFDVEDLVKLADLSLDLCTVEDFRRMLSLLEDDTLEITNKGLKSYIDHYFQRLKTICADNIKESYPQRGLNEIISDSTTQRLLESYEKHDEQFLIRSEVADIIRACARICKMSYYIKLINWQQNIIDEAKERELLGRWRKFVHACGRENPHC